MSKISVLVGADPEVFVCDKDGNIVPAHLFTTGTKEKPEVIEPGYLIHYDNIALEFNFPPADSVQDFQEKMKLSMDICEDAIGWNHDLLIRSAVRLPMETLESWGPPAMMFRCEMEDNIWGDNQYPMQEPDVRSTGAHVHIGWGMNVPRPQQELVAQWCDAIIGLSLVHLDDEAAPMRRSMYGKPGSIRFKPYGIEYRTPSSQWIADCDSQELVFNLIQRTVQTAMKHGAFPFYEHISTIKDVITRSDKEQAGELVEFFAHAV